MSSPLSSHPSSQRRYRYRQRVYVEPTKPLEQYTTEELYARFRFGKADIEYLVNLLWPKLQHRTQRSHGLSVKDQIFIALRFYACCSLYQVIGDYMGVAKSAVCDVVKDVSIALASLVNEFVSFQPDCQQSTAHGHIQAQAPRILRERDGAYPLLPWLMTPFLTANTPTQAHFNTAHCIVRCVIECLNGVLKRRFACLNYLRAEPQKACNITLACIVLHNIATKCSVPLCADNDAPEPLGDPDQPPAFCQNEQTGRATRDTIVRHYF
uniref:Putative nuclease HARBI1 n=1 Tax=Lates calcarifer TaxID=8187 RepID=A0A4W6DA47_LATCA